MNLPILWAPLILRNKITARHLWQHKSTCHLLWGWEVFQTRCHDYSTVSGNFSAPKINGDFRHRAPWEIQTMMDSKSRAKVGRQKTLWPKRLTARCASLNIKMTSIPATSLILVLTIFCVRCLCSHVVCMRNISIPAYDHYIVFPCRLWCLLFAAQTFYAAVFMSEKMTAAYCRLRTIKGAICNIQLKL